MDVEQRVAQPVGQACGLGVQVGDAAHRQPGQVGYLDVQRAGTPSVRGTHRDRCTTGSPSTSATDRPSPGPIP
jgi:hypothetical protein